jgi:flagellar biosynthesis/type III secretory pathway protein FliH
MPTKAAAGGPLIIPSREGDMDKVAQLRAELAEMKRQRDVWEGHFHELNATAGQWRLEAEALQAENDKLREFIERDKRSHLANARADGSLRAKSLGGNAVRS